MAKQRTEESKEIQVKKPNSIFEEITQLDEAINKRAYELFQNPEGRFAGPLANWFRAERELIWCPAIELRQHNGHFELDVALAGMDPKDLDVQVTPEDILITATGEHQHETKEGTTHISEFASGRLFRSVHLPERIDPERVKAEFRNGMLRVTTAVAKPETKKVDIQAA